MSTARRLGLLRVEAVPEFGGDRVLDRQRVDVARRQREDRGEDAPDDLEEAPLRVRVDLVRRHRERHHGEDDAPPVRRERNARAAAEAEAAAQRRVVERRRRGQKIHPDPEAPGNIKVPYTYLPDAGGICENRLKSRRAIFALVLIFYYI